METATSSVPLHHRIRHLLFRLPMMTEFLIRHFTFVTLKEYYLSLFFFNSGLFPLTIDLDRDTSIHLWIPTHRNHRRIPLLLIHGFGGNSKWQWQKQIVSLSKSFDLYIPDLIFFGRSTTLSSDRSVEFQAQCFVETMRRLGVDKYAVCGISYGGFVAFRMADMAVKEVEKLVILTAGVCMTDKQKKEMVEREERDVIEILLPQKGEDLMELLRRSMHRPPRWVPAFLLRDFIEVMYKDNRNERVNMLNELLVNGASADSLPVLTQETLLIWGNQDNVFPTYLAHQLNSSGQAVHRLIILFHATSHLGKKSRLEIVKDAGHACQLENPDSVNYLIENFLLESN